MTFKIFDFFQKSACNLYILVLKYIYLLILFKRFVFVKHFSNFNSKIRAKAGLIEKKGFSKNRTKRNRK